MATKNVSVDTDINNYTLAELMAIIEVQELDPNEIVKKTNVHVNKFKKSDPHLSAFFLEVQSQLLRYAQGLIVEKDKDVSDKIVVETYQNMSGSSDAPYTSGNKQVNNWFQNEYLMQDDPNQTSKITNRQQTTQTFGNAYVPMNQAQVATTDTYNLPVKQDSLNPTLKNVITRFVNLDSQFRQYSTVGDSSSTEYTLDLSDTLKDSLSLSLYSYQIPFSWYVIDKAYGNTCMWILDGTDTVAVSVPPGNYSQIGFTTQLNTSFDGAGFTPSPSTVPIVSYNANSGILSLFLYGATFTGANIEGDTVSFTVSETTIIMFYDFSGKLRCSNNCFSKSNIYLNNSLGWIMGYRLPYITVNKNGNSAPAIIDLNGTKYLILVIDDYNQNHVNNNVVSISQFTNSLKTPSYYSLGMPLACSTPAQQKNNLQELIAGVTINSAVEFQTTNPLNGLLIGGKYEQYYTRTQQVLPSAPRTLTQSQLYTVNEINKNRTNNTTNYLSTAPTSGDILAIIPVKTSTGVPTGSLLVEFSGSLQDNKRIYFGPVDIDRMAIKLLDDKGNVLNLNGNDWCVTLVCECLYQY
jgi:hypothetical protein